MVRRSAALILTVSMAAGTSLAAQAAAPARPNAPAQTLPAQQPAITAPVTLYGDVRPAQQHCPRDEIVWLNLATGVYHTRGQSYYARTGRGVYMCRAEADRTGFRASRDGS
jgi:hypothetical protein